VHCPLRHQEQDAHWSASLRSEQCTEFGIEHRLSPPCHPQTNGVVERFNGRVAEVIEQTHLASASELKSTLKNCVAIYNRRIPQRALEHRSPIEAMKKWQRDRPELFVKRVYDQARLESQQTPKHCRPGTHLCSEGLDASLLKCSDRARPFGSSNVDCEAQYRLAGTCRSRRPQAA